MNTVVCALYHFVALPDYAELRRPILDVMEGNSLRGTILLALEGINGTIAGERGGIDALLNFLGRDDRFRDLRHKESYDHDMPFLRAKVKLKKEIVTMGVPEIDPKEIVGTYVAPKDWNQLIDDPNVTVIDTRNEYEVAIGTFERAINPHTTTFRQFPAFAQANLNPEKNKKIAMFCTGGIRCEKSTAYLKSQGFDDVYHLEGGILKYLEEVPETESRWQGECFVFDNRVTVNHDLERGHYDQCHACRMPIDDDDKASTSYVPGISCRHCIDQVSDEQRARFVEREKQVHLANARGETHIGSDAVAAQRLRKTQKGARKAAQRKNQIP